MLQTFKQYGKHKPVLILLLVVSVVFGIVEYLAVKGSSGNLTADTLSSASIVFLFANLANLAIVSWALIWLMRRTTEEVIRIKISSIVFAFVKSLFTMLMWAAFFFVIVSVVIEILLPGLALLDKNSQALDMIDQILLMVVMAFFVGYSYAILMTTFAASLLRRQSAPMTKSRKPVLAKWYVPFMAAYFSLTQPVVWAALLAALLCKGAGFWLAGQGWFPLAWLTEAAALIFVFFGFFASYQHYAKPQLEAAISTGSGE